jgi:hypothetical protein
LKRVWRWIRLGGLGEEYGDAGVRPGSRSTFLSGKVDKTMLAVARPFGCPARFADTGGALTRYAQTVRTFSPVSAARLGLTTRPGFLATLALVGRGKGEGVDEQ